MQYFIFRTVLTHYSFHKSTTTATTIQYSIQYSNNSIADTDMFNIEYV